MTTTNFTINFTTIRDEVHPVPNITYFNDSLCSISIVNNCKQFNSYDAITMTISGLTNIDLTYNVFCDSDTVLSPFQYGLIVLVVVNAIQIIICS